MDNSNNSGPSTSQDNTQAQQKYNNRFYKSRQQPEKPYKDLRELLNHKRQNNETTTGGPPSEPKYNYLSDPMRDIEQQTDNNLNIGSGRGSHTNQRFNSNRNSNYNPSRGRGRGNYSENSNRAYHRQGHANNWRDDNFGDSHEPAKFTREWDQGKEDSRNFGQTRTYAPRYSTHKKPFPDSSQNRYDPSEGRSAPSNYRPHNNESSNYRPPQRYHDNRPSNYKGPPHKFNPNFNRGGFQQKYSPRRNQNIDPVNISVEYTVEDGSRKCVALEGKLDKVWNKRDNRKLEKSKEQRVVEEENWDEDVGTSVKIDQEVEANSTKEENENENLQKNKDDLDKDIDTQKKEEEIEDAQSTEATDDSPFEDVSSKVEQKLTNESKVDDTVKIEDTPNNNDIPQIKNETLLTKVNEENQNNEENKVDEKIINKEATT